MGLRPGDGHLRYSEKTGAMKRLTTAQRLRRRRQLLARRPVDRLLVDARAATTARSTTRRRSRSRRTRATSPRSTSCRPTASGQKRLTNVSGYDGGPFFTHDGKQIVWRRFDEQGLIADVWTMKPDGTRSEADHRLRLDELGAVHASVGRVLHLRVEQARVRELRAVHGRRGGHEGAGAGHLLAGFDGLPVPSPDGKRSRGRRAAPAAPAGQLFLAQWNHEKALEALKNAPPRKPAKKS